MVVHMIHACAWCWCCEVTDNYDEFACIVRMGSELEGSEAYVYSVYNTVYTYMQ